jgi:hypothetical protein
MSAAAANHARDELESNRAHMRRKETLEAEQDKARLTRKALAVLVELQQLHDEKGSIKKSLIYAVAAEMGLDEQEVHQSRILKQGLESMRVVDDTTSDLNKSVSLESLGIDSSNLSKLLNSVAPKDSAVIAFLRANSHLHSRFIRKLILSLKWRPASELQLPRRSYDCRIRRMLTCLGNFVSA